MLSKEEIKPFAIASIKKHLKAITNSNNYFLISDNYTVSICYKTQKYLLPIDKQYNRNYSIIKHVYYNSNEINEVLHSLILVKKLKSIKESNMPLHTFISEVLSWVSMCSSMLAYYTNEEYFKSRNTYDLPEFIKREIYNYMKSVKHEVKTNVGTDSEGNSYNSISFAEVL